MSRNVVDGTPVRENASGAMMAAMVGVVVGYLVHRHWPEIDWFFRILMG
jgi:hypothetical protein